jgi:hypothetical protein
VLGVDLVQATGIACETANQGIFLVGFFLLGAGLITSDQHAAVIQGRRAPAGPPETVPGPKSSDLRG